MRWKLLFFCTFFVQLVLSQERKGVLSGQLRNYYLSTWNEAELKDFRALATGLKIAYDYKLTSYLLVRGAVYSSFNWNIQDLSKADPITNRLSRYELGLFDVNNPDDRVLIFPGELNVKLGLGIHSFTVGRMKLVSPLINPQDGRMIPTLEQGIRYSMDDDSFSIGLGLFNAIAPRSTDGFSGIGESIGLYPQGRQTDGTSGLYRGNVESDYLMIANTSYSRGFWKMVIWNYAIQNVSNSLHMRQSLNWKEKNLKLEFETVRQDRLGDGGNSIDSLRYFQDRSSNLVGIRLTKRSEVGEFSLAYNRILDGGRFLFPREFGREGLFSFQKRERTEGMANNHALVAYFNRSYDFGMRSIISVGHHWKPDFSEVESNKYALPSYFHFNFDFFYSIEKAKNLKPELLLTYKIPSGDIPDNPNLKLNKVNVFLINAIVNYNF